VNAIGHLQSGVTAVLCFAAASLAFIFSLLDRRNRDLVWLGEELLTDLEKNAIFGQGITIKDRSGKDIQLGILSRQSFEDNARRNNWGTWRRVLDEACRGKHRVWLRFVAYLMTVLFFTAGVWILKHPQ
jgi:hypothetical protein